MDRAIRGLLALAVLLVLVLGILAALGLLSLSTVVVGVVVAILGGIALIIIDRRLGRVILSVESVTTVPGHYLSEYARSAASGGIPTRTEDWPSNYPAGWKKRGSLGIFIW